MIASSKTVKLLAVSAAALVHGAALWGLSVAPEVKIEGTGAAPVVSLGSSFADLAAGTLSAESDPDPAEAVTPEQAEAMPEPEASKTPDIAETQSADPPKPAVPVLATTPQSAQPTEFAARVPLSTPMPAQPATGPGQPIEVVIPVTPVETLAASALTRPVDTAIPTELETTAVTRSLRPQTRSAAFEKAPEAKQVKKLARSEKPKKPTKKKADPQPKGNAKQNAKAGSATGQAKVKAKSASSGQAKKKKAGGTAAASNYPGTVMHKIARVPKPRVGSKGSAVVAFTIAPNGGLAAISLARSSGSGQLDKAALRVVRKAAPFPPPPSGARRSFSIRIKGS